MAIFYCQMSVVSRSTGRSAVAAAAYRSGETLLNERDGREHVYEQRAGIGHSEIVLPDALVVDAAFDGWALDRSKLWNAAELAEKRSDARVAREFVVALPAELSDEGRIELTRDFGRVLSNRYGVAVDFAIHAPHPKGDVRNHHAHVLMTTRTVTRDGFGPKSFLEFANKDLVRLGLASTQTQLVDLRRFWEGLANERLALEGFDVRIDHRSHAERGLEIEPTGHMGVSATNVQRRGGQVDRGRIGEDAARRNAELIAEKPDQILSVITGEKSVFDRYDIARALHRYINDDVDAYTRAFASVMASPALVTLLAERVDHQTGEIEPARYSTREMVDVETGMIEAVRRMQGSRGHGVGISHVDHAIAAQDDAIRRSMGVQGNGVKSSGGRLSEYDVNIGQSKIRQNSSVVDRMGGVLAIGPANDRSAGSGAGLSDEQRRAIEQSANDRLHNASRIPDQGMDEQDRFILSGSGVETARAGQLSSGGTGGTDAARIVPGAGLGGATGRSDGEGQGHADGGVSGSVRTARDMQGLIADATTDVASGHRQGSAHQTVARLSDEQRHAIAHITGPERIAVVVGFAGAGKSTMLSAAREAWEAQGYSVHGAALSGKAAEGLEASSGIESRTLASWDMSWQNGKRELGRNDVFVIDEAGMVGSRQLARFVSEAETRGAKIVLVGDHEQLQAIGAGAPFRAIAEETGHAELSEIRRQKVDWQREASVAFATHRTADGLALYRDHGDVHFAETRDAARAQIVLDYLADRDARAYGSRVAMAHRRVDVRAINDAIRSELQARGELARAERPVPEEPGDISGGKLAGTEMAGIEGDAEGSAGASPAAVGPDPADERGSGDGKLPGVLTSGRDGQSPIASRTDMMSVLDTVRHPGVTATGVGQAQAYLYQTRDGVREFATGDRIVFLENSRELGVKNGMPGKIAAVEPDMIHVVLDGKVGETEKPAVVKIPVKDYQSIDHGYATTIHKNQGATVDRAFVLASGTMDRHLTYVAMTRHRDGVHLYADADEFAGMGQVRRGSGQAGHSQGRNEGPDAGRAEGQNAVHHTGRLIAHGPAPYGNIQDTRRENQCSYFVTLEDAKGEHRTVWGVDLERAMKEVRPGTGDMIGLKREGSEMVRLPDSGDVTRNIWSVQDQNALAYAGLADRLSRSGAKETTLDYMGSDARDMPGVSAIGGDSDRDIADFGRVPSAEQAFAERRGIADAFGIRSEIDVGRLASIDTRDRSAPETGVAMEPGVSRARGADNTKIAGNAYGERLGQYQDSEYPVPGAARYEYILPTGGFSLRLEEDQPAMGRPETSLSAGTGLHDERSLSGAAGMSDPSISTDPVHVSGHQPEREDKSYLEDSAGRMTSVSVVGSDESTDRSGAFRSSADPVPKPLMKRGMFDGLKLNAGPIFQNGQETRQTSERSTTLRPLRDAQPDRPDSSEQGTGAEPERNQLDRDPLLERLQQQSPFEVAVDHYARALGAIDRQLDQGLPVLEGQTRAFAQARHQLEQARPGSSELAASAYRYDPEFGQAITSLSGPARVRHLIAGMERERQLIADPDVRADRFIRNWQDLQAERNELVGQRHPTQDLARVNDQMQGLVRSLERDREVETVLENRCEELGITTGNRHAGRVSEDLKRSLDPDRRDDRERGRDRDRDFER